MEYNYNDANFLPPGQNDLIDFLPESNVDTWENRGRTEAPVLKSKDRGHVNSDVVAIKSGTGDIAFVAVGRPQSKNIINPLKSARKKSKDSHQSLPRMIANPAEAGIDNFGYQTISRNESYTYDDTGFNYYSHLDDHAHTQSPTSVHHQPRYVPLNTPQTKTQISATARRGSYGDIPSTSQQLFDLNMSGQRSRKESQGSINSLRQPHTTNMGRISQTSHRSSPDRRERGHQHSVSAGSIPSQRPQEINITSPISQTNAQNNTWQISSQPALESNNVRQSPQTPDSNASSRHSSFGQSSHRHSQDSDPPTPSNTSTVSKLPPLCRTCGQNHGVTENHEYDYVDEVDEDLMCDICLQPLVDPYDTKCGHTFCSVCLKNYLRVKHICPVDRVELTNSPTDCWQSSLILRKLVNKLKVTCPHEEFCKKSLQRCDLKDHLQDSCPGAIIRCSKSMYGCSYRGPRAKMESHLEDCVFKDFTDKLSDLHPFCKDVTVELFRPEGTAELGVLIVGGSDTPLHYIVIQEILKDSLAGHDGRLQCGDIVADVNGESMFSVTHAEARSILMKPSSLMRFTLLRDVPKEESTCLEVPEQNPYEELICLVKPPLEQLGIRISTSETGENGVYIIELIPGQVARTDGRLQAGDRIIKIGNIDFTDSTPEHAARVINSCEREVKILVRHVYPRTTGQESVVEGAHERKSKLKRSETFVVVPKATKSSRTKKFISVVKGAKENLGIIVSGGNGSPRGNLPIFVQDVLPLSVLGKDKRIKRGDLLSEINSIKLNGLSHNQAMSILRESAQQREVSLLVYELDYEGKAEDEALWDELTSMHQNPSKWAPSWKMWLAASKDFSSMKEIVLKRSVNSNYGFKISGGVTEESGTSPIFVTHVSKCSFASKYLKCGDEIVSINKKTVKDLQHYQVLNLMRSANTITLKIISWPGSLH